MKFTGKVVVMAIFLFVLLDSCEKETKPLVPVGYQGTRPQTREYNFSLRWEVATRCGPGISAKVAIQPNLLDSLGQLKILRVYLHTIYKTWRQLSPDYDCMGSSCGPNTPCYFVQRIGQDRFLTIILRGKNIKLSNRPGDKVKVQVGG